MSRDRIQLRDVARERIQDETLKELAKRLRELEQEVLGQEKGPFPIEEY